MSLLIVLFFVCPKKRTKRKGSHSLDPPTSDYPVLLELVGRLRNSLRSDSPRADPANFVLLGNVKWHNKNFEKV